MKKLLSLILIAILLSQGCSAYIVHKRNEKRNQIDSKLSIGTPRSEILDLLGEPVRKDEELIDLYSVCVPRYENPEYNLLLDIVFIGFWEIWAVPYELSVPCDYKRELAIIYDKKYNVAAILQTVDYEKVKSIYNILIKTLDKLDSDHQLIYINYNKERGWFYIDKSSIQCNSQKKGMKAIILNVLSLTNAIQYMDSHNLKTIPLLARETVLFDLVNSTYNFSTREIFDDEDKRIETFYNDSWIAIDSDAFMSKLKDLLTYYCLHRKIDKHEIREKPSLWDYFGE
ncbi:MAG: hypothetical protein V1689_02950 [Pseudomonadota bacterium]